MLTRNKLTKKYFLFSVLGGTMHIFNKFTLCSKLRQRSQLYKPDINLYVDVFFDIMHLKISLMYFTTVFVVNQHLKFAF